MAKNFSISVETDNFKKHVNDFLRRGKVSTEIAIKKFAFDLLNRIMRKNPVDTGRSRAGWYVAMERLGQGKGFVKSGTSKNYSEEAVQEGRSKSKFIDHTGNFLDQWIEIVNGVNYIIRLEYGSSDQAPYGMVRISMRELRRGKLPEEMLKRLKEDWNKFY